MQLPLRLPQPQSEGGEEMRDIEVRVDLVEPPTRYLSGFKSSERPRSYTRHTQLRCVDRLTSPQRTMTIVGATLTSQRYRSSGMSIVRVSTIRVGMWPVCRLVVSRGLSLRSVSPPMITASEWARSSCTAARAVGPAVGWVRRVGRAQDCEE